jgi:4-hydroxy-3-polyprenylbenzoate decarboxylase
MSKAKKKNIAIAISGASGSIYAQRLLKKIRLLENQVNRIVLVFSENAKQIWKEELGQPLPNEEGIQTFENTDFNCPLASGSNNFDILIIVPASMGVVGRIANGISNDLISRAGDVMLKERRKLIVVPRETPYSLVHIRNMETITLAGGIICPATPSFYQNPKNINELVDTVVDRIIDLAGLEQNTYRWGE